MTPRRVAADPPDDARRAVPAPRERRVVAFGAVLPPDFYARAVEEVARDLLGMVLVADLPDGRAAVRITETEAYLGPHDPASHAVRGRTPATRALFGAPGTLYVYRSYGLHWCANAVTAPEGYGAAVLLRAGEPVSGHDVLRARRGDRVPPHELAAGPGRLAAALGLTRAHDGASLVGGAVTIHEAAGIADDAVLVTRRIGITRAAEWPLRYVVKDTRHVSRTPGRFPRQEYRRCLPLPSGAASAPPPSSPSS